MKKSLLFGFIYFSAQLFGQSIETSNPYYLGHSLVNFTMPSIVNNLAISGGKTSEYSSQIMNGASMHSNFQNWASAQGTPYTQALPTGKYDAFIITEAVPLLNHTTWSNTYNVANDFLSYARNYQPNIRYFIYETWHCINTGRTDTVIPEIAPRVCWYDDNDQLLWQPRLLNDFPKWAKIVDSVRTLQDYDQVFMVPAGQAFYNLSKEIDAGNVPGYTSFRQFFEDDIHLNRSGNYFVACVMYSCIFRSNPEGLSSKMNDEWGNPWIDIPVDVASIMQKVAWETVCENTYSGVDCSLITSTSDASSDQSSITVYPQPASDIITISNLESSSSSYSLIDNLGNVRANGIIDSESMQINLSNISSGIYTLLLHQESSTVSRKVHVVR